MNLQGYKTYLGLIVAALPTLAGLFGYVASPDVESQLPALVDELVTLIGLALALYGRAVAQVPGWLSRK